MSHSGHNLVWDTPTVTFLKPIFDNVKQKRQRLHCSAGAANTIVWNRVLPLQPRTANCELWTGWNFYNKPICFNIYFNIFVWQCRVAAFLIFNAFRCTSNSNGACRQVGYGVNVRPEWGPYDWDASIWASRINNAKGPKEKKTEREREKDLLTRPARGVRTLKLSRVTFPELAKCNKFAKRRRRRETAREPI